MGVGFVFIAPIILFLDGSLLFTWIIIVVVYLGIQFMCYLHILVINDEDQHNFAANIIIYNIIGISLFFLVPELFPGFPLILTLLFEIPIASCFYYFLYVLNRASKHWRTKEVMESLLIALDEHFQTRDYVLLAEWGWITGHLGVLQILLQQYPNFTLNENGTKLVKAKPTG